MVHVHVTTKTGIQRIKLKIHYGGGNQSTTNLLQVNDKLLSHKVVSNIPSQVCELNFQLQW